MNLSIPCGLSTRFFTTVLFFIGFGIAHAQLNLPKTLDDPGTSPTYIINWSDYSTISAFQVTQVLSSNGIITLARTDSATSTIRFAEDADRDYSINHYRFTYTDDTHSTPEPINIAADTIPITTNLQLQFTLDPFVAYQQEQYNPDELQPLTPYFGQNVRLGFVVFGVLSPPDEYGTSGTPIVFSAAELAVLGDSDGHTLQLAQHGSSPALSTTIEIAPNADAQSIINSIQLAATAVQIYVEFTENEDGSLSIYADEALEIGEPDTTTTPTASKTLDDPGVNPSVTFSWLDGESRMLTVNRSSLLQSEVTYNLDLSSDGNKVILDERSDYTAAHPLTYVSDTQLTPVRLYDNDSVLLADNPSFTVSLDPFVMAQHDSPIEPYFWGVFDNNNNERRFAHLHVTSFDIPFEASSEGTVGTPVSFTAKEITAIMAADSTSLAVVQTATGLRSTLTVPTDTDAQGLADHIQAAANPLTVYIHAVRGILSVVDPCEDADQDETCDEELIIEYDGTLDIYADEAIEIHYTTANTASIAPLRKQGVLVYPNPVRTQLHLVYPSATPASYTVYDLTGKAHSTHHASGQTHQLNVSNLAKGVYLLKAEHGNQTGVFRFVKE